MAVWFVSHTITLFTFVADNGDYAIYAADIVYQYYYLLRDINITIIIVVTVMKTLFFIIYIRYGLRYTLLVTIRHYYIRWIIVGCYWLGDGEWATPFDTIISSSRHCLVLHILNVIVAGRLCEEKAR